VERNKGWRWRGGGGGRGWSHWSGEEVGGGGQGVEWRGGGGGEGVEGERGEGVEWRGGGGGVPSHWLMVWAEQLPANDLLMEARYSPRDIWRPMQPFQTNPPTEPSTKFHSTPGSEPSERSILTSPLNHSKNPNEPLNQPKNLQKSTNEPSEMSILARSLNHPKNQFAAMVNL
jgi:hypothetical protein